MKKTKGITLVELLIVLYIDTVIIIGSVAVFTLFSGIYKERQKESSAAYEALMYIHYYINKYGEEISVEKENEITITLEEGKRQDIIKTVNGDLRIYYMNKSAEGHETKYTYQPILYDVDQFVVEKSKNILCIHIWTKDGVEVKKTIGKL